MKTNQLYHDLELPSHLCRSRLFCIEPVGIGTQLTESLISLTVRLAEAHCLPPGMLMEKEVAPIIARTHGGNLHKIYSHTAALNSTGVMALNLASALEKLSGQKNLHLLTLAPWSELMPSRKLLRRDRAWCPVCYENWYTTKNVIYEPLLWSLEVVKACPSHRCLLLESCPYCHQKNLPLAWNSRPGYCSKCQEWLGSLPSNLAENLKNFSEDESKALIWIADSVGDLLASTPYLTSPVTKDSFAQAFRAHINLVSNGNIAEFARQLQLPKNTVWLWCNGRNLPQLDTWVHICYRLNSSLIDFLTQRPEQDICLTPVKVLGPLHSKPRAEPRVIDTDHLEQQLEIILLNHECPPPPMEEVARRLEIHRETIFRLFPEMCRAISAKYDQFQKIRHHREIEQSRKEINQAVLKLYSEGLYPSEGQVAQLMSKPGYLRYKQVRAAIKEAKLEFNTQGRNLPNS
ncbi:MULTISPECIES: TniQ family protein [Trichocoleus]|uniref:TniQ family protein n=1 Tax=Trichocoleus desertorum GB2-A4 TaxID=2933944 RepID=A0ABV0JE84_9CYAN|nr:TniQ family protein [Trichocoleus sp. FACHB-46]MBD1864002.1 TniQ family protein [Trichocoleus sp. FACHB-46]